MQMNDNMLDDPTGTAPEHADDFQDADTEPPIPEAIPVRERVVDLTGEVDRPRRKRRAALRPRENKDISLSHHAARCGICNHPDRDAIEQAFLHWERPGEIAYHFGLGSRLVVYRHARALGLSQRRNERGQHALGYLIEQAPSVKPTADSIIRAVKALGCFDTDGHYREPRREILITHQVLPAVAPIPNHEYAVLPTAADGSPLQLKLIDTRVEQKQDLTQAGSLR